MIIKIQCDLGINYKVIKNVIKDDWKMRDAIQRYDPFQYATWDQYSFLWMWRSL